MNFIYFHTSTTEAIEQALTDGTPVICSGGARDLPNSRRGILWDACQGIREYEIRVRRDRSDVSSSDIVRNLDMERESFHGEEDIDIEDFS